MTDDLATLAKLWLLAKEGEREFVNDRRDLEDRMKSLVGVSENLEGAEIREVDGYMIKVTGRIDHKVDAELVQELAAEFNLTSHLSSLFRWKPEINMSVWKTADSEITEPLAGAITTKPGRPSFSIVIKEQ